MVPGQFAEEDKIAELTLIKITQNHASVLRVVSRQFCGYIISMDLTNISEVKNILKTHRLWAKKRLGQHFLISKSVLKKIIQSSDLKKSDVVLEIGAGLGVLTLELLNKVKKVIAVEKDPLMAKILEENAKNFKNLKIINQDILKLDLQKEIPEKYKEIGQPVLIPGSMGTASYVLVGTEKSKEAWYTVCHGAGRTMSRHQAIKTLSAQEIVKNLESKGIIVKCWSMRGIAEEAPQAYKNIDEIVEVVHQAGLAKKVAKLKPLAVIKGE